MRSPLPRNRIVALTLLAATLSLAVTAGLAYPTLLPGVSPDAGNNPSASTVGTPAPVADAPAPAQDAGNATAESTAATPTPNPDFTPAVQTATGGEDEEDEHDWWRGDDDEREEETGEWEDD